MSNPWRELLPTSIKLGGDEYEIRSDYRAALDICAALSDPDLSDQDKAEAALDVLYPDFSEMPPEHYQEALERCMWFLNCGDEADTRSSPKLVEWEQDFKHIVAPINRVTGQEVRAIEYMHWWTFIAAYNEIGDCTFAQIVRIRDQLARGKKLDKTDLEWYRRNKKLVDMKQQYSKSEEETLKAWGV